MFKLLMLSLGLLLLSGCSSYGVVGNRPLSKPITTDTTTSSYSIVDYARKEQSSRDLALTLAFSGGGTRAAALSYGVLEELRDTIVIVNGKPRRLLDEIDIISSVSGGSFTSAYYGLHGDGIFENYKEVFLLNDIESKLFWGLFNPLSWFSSTGRTEMAVKLYEKEIFHGATFADIQREGGPLIAINASDLAYGVRFSFVQEYFDLLCSDISSFPVARAVTASSAVPLVFNPIVVKNYQDCEAEGKPHWLIAAKKRLANNHDMNSVVRGLEGYYKDNSRQYVHFVDGGITDNLGLRAIYDVIELAGGAGSFYRNLGVQHPRYVVLISVNASTEPEQEMDRSRKQPSVTETINAMSDVQLHRYNDATIELTEKSMLQWAKSISTPDRIVTPYHVQVRFTDLDSPKKRLFFNRIPTSFSLSEEQIDQLILAGRELLRNNPEYQRMLTDLGKVHKGAD